MFLRRIIRRAIRHGYALGAEGMFFYQFVNYLVDEMGEAYPLLAKKSKMIAQQIKQEELQFAVTLNNGMRLLDNIIKDTKKTNPRGDCFLNYMILMVSHVT